MRDLTDASAYLKEKSKEVCALNHCDTQNGIHACESYAYFRADGALLDVCLSDYFTGSAAPVACIPLPWGGSAAELALSIEDQCAEEAAEQPRYVLLSAAGSVLRYVDTLDEARRAVERDEANCFRVEAR